MSTSSCGVHPNVILQVGVRVLDVHQFCCTCLPEVYTAANAGRTILWCHAFDSLATLHACSSRVRLFSTSLDNVDDTTFQKRSGSAMACLATACYDPACWYSMLV